MQVISFNVLVNGKKIQFQTYLPAEIVEYFDAYARDERYTKVVIFEAIFRGVMGLPRELLDQIVRTNGAALTDLVEELRVRRSEESLAEDVRRAAAESGEKPTGRKRAATGKK